MVDYISWGPEFGFGFLDGIEGNYSRETAIKYSEYDHIVVSTAKDLSLPL